MKNLKRVLSVLLSVVLLLGTAPFNLSLAATEVPEAGDHSVTSIELIEASSNTLIEEYDGYWEKDETFGSYFQYTYGTWDFWDATIQINYDDGTSEQRNPDDTVYVGYDKWVFDIEDNQSAENPWGIGVNDATIKFHPEDSEEGFTTTFPIEVVESPVDSLEVIQESERTLVEQESDEHYSYSSSDFSDAIIKVTFKNGEEKECHPGEYVTLDDDFGSEIYIRDNQWDNIDAGNTDKYWKKGKNEAEVTFLGKSAPFYITIVENPIDSIEVKAGTSHVFFEGEGKYNEWYGYDIYSYSSSDFSDAVIQINFKDGTTKDANIGDEVLIGATRYQITCDDEQYLEPWTVDSSNFLKVELLDRETTLSISVVENPISSIEIVDNKPHYIAMEANGSWQYDSDGNKYFQYFLYDVFFDDVNVKINYIDGTNKIVHPGDNIKVENNSYHIRVDSDQYHTHWHFGEDNYAFINLLGKTAEFPITICASNKEKRDISILPGHIATWTSTINANDLMDAGDYLTLTVTSDSMGYDENESKLSLASFLSVSSTRLQAMVEIESNLFEGAGKTSYASIKWQDNQATAQPFKNNLVADFTIDKRWDSNLGQYVCTDNILVKLIGLDSSKIDNQDIQVKVSLFNNNIFGEQDTYWESSSLQGLVDDNEITIETDTTGQIQSISDSSLSLAKFMESNPHITLSSYYPESLYIALSVKDSANLDFSDITFEDLSLDFMSYVQSFGDEYIQFAPYCLRQNEIIFAQIVNKNYELGNSFSPIKINLNNFGDELNLEDFNIKVGFANQSDWFDTIEESFEEETPLFIWESDPSSMPKLRGSLYEDDSYYGGKWSNGETSCHFECNRIQGNSSGDIISLFGIEENANLTLKDARQLSNILSNYSTKIKFYGNFEGCESSRLEVCRFVRDKQGGATGSYFDATICDNYIEFTNKNESTYDYIEFRYTGDIDFQFTSISLVVYKESKQQEESNIIGDLNWYDEIVANDNTIIGKWESLLPADVVESTIVTDDNRNTENVVFHVSEEMIGDCNGASMSWKDFCDSYIDNLEPYQAVIVEGLDDSMQTFNRYRFSSGGYMDDWYHLGAVKIISNDYDMSISKKIYHLNDVLSCKSDFVVSVYVVNVAQEVSTKGIPLCSNIHLDNENALSWDITNLDGLKEIKDNNGWVVLYIHAKETDPFPVSSLDDYTVELSSVVAKETGQPLVFHPSGISSSSIVTYLKGDFDILDDLGTLTLTCLADDANFTISATTDIYANAYEYRFEKMNRKENTEHGYFQYTHTYWDADEINGIDTFSNGSYTDYYLSSESVKSIFGILIEDGIESDEKVAWIPPENIEYNDYIEVTYSFSENIGNASSRRGSTFGTNYNYYPYAFSKTISYEEKSITFKTEGPAFFDIVPSPKKGGDAYDFSVLNEALLIGIHIDYCKATWIPQYEVSVVNGTSDKELAEEGETVSVSADTPATGKVFDKWEATGITLTSEQETADSFEFTMPANDVALTATYKDAEYSVTVDGTVQTSTAKYGDEITVSVDAITGKTFAGWTTEGLTLTSDQSKSMSVTFSMPANDVVFTSSFTDDEYTVTVVNGISNKETAKYGEAVTVTANEAPVGYKFTGWTSDDVTVTDNGFTMPAKDVTVTANYEKIPYNVTVIEGSSDKEVAYYGDVVSLTAKAPATGVEFDKWVVNKGTVSLTDATSMNTTFTMPAEDVEIEATYKLINYKVTVINGTPSKSTANYNDAITLEADEAPVGYKFTGWTSDDVTVTDNGFTMPAKDVTVTANYEPVEYTITVINGKGSQTKAIYGDEITLEADEPETGYKFTGWTSDDVTVTDNGFTMPAKDVTVTANFEKVDYTITVINGSSSKAAANYGDAITLTYDKPETGYRFTGWTSDDVTVTDDGFTMPAKDVTVTANYEKIPYSVTVIEGSSDKETAYYGDVVSLTAKAPATGVAFDKWVVNKGTVSLTDVTSMNTTFTMPAEDVEIEATYKLINYKVTVINGTPSKSTANYNDVITLEANEAPIGYKFTGWTSDDVTVTDNQFTMPAKDVTITANYEPVDYTVTVINGAGSKTVAQYQDSVTLKADEPEEGKLFDKWVIKQGKFSLADATSMNASFTMPAEDVEIEATYKPIMHTVTFIAANDEGTYTYEGAQYDKVDVVEFAEGDTSVKAPDVPTLSDNYVGYWEDYTLGKEDIVVKAVYEKKRSDNQSDLETEKEEDFDEGTGVATITLNAFAETRNAKVNMGADPYDIVLVVDQSGSMAYVMGSDRNPESKRGETSADTRREKLKTVASNFVNMVYESAQENGVDHRVAIVGFASGSNYKYQNTEVLTPSATQYSTKGMSKAYAAALLSVTNKKSVIDTAIKGIDSEGATAANYGFEMAEGIFANTDGEGRKRLIVFLTDGVPTTQSTFSNDVANNAIDSAKNLKNVYGATIYSIGISSAANPEDMKQNFNIFLHSVSSNYPNAVSMKNVGKAAPTKDYFLKASDADALTASLREIFAEKICNTVSFENMSLFDTLSKNFTLTTEQELALRENAKAQYGLTDEDVVITRNSDGTTTILVSNMSPKPRFSPSGVMEGYEVSLTFEATANENAIKAGNYALDTEAGVIKDGVQVAAFDSSNIVMNQDSCLVKFLIGDEVYSIVHAKAGDHVDAPETDLAKWNVSQSFVISKPVTEFTTSLETEKKTVTWIVNGKETKETYQVGEEIQVPTVSNPAGKLFAGWDMPVPSRMPEENLTFTAKFVDHTHTFVLSEKTGTCDEGITNTYVCECGETKTEKLDPCEHSFTARLLQENGETVSIMICTNCGAQEEHDITYQAAYTEEGIDHKGEQQDGKTQIYDIKMLDDNNQAIQPTDPLKMRIPLTEEMQNAPDKLKIYRLKENNKKDYMSYTIEGEAAVFEVNHFSCYVATVDEEKEESLTFRQANVALGLADINYGDVNTDGNIDMKDILLLRKFVADMEEAISQVDIYNADVNANNYIDMKDILFLRKYVAKMITELGPGI